MGACLSFNPRLFENDGITAYPHSPMSATISSSTRNTRHVRLRSCFSNASLVNHCQEDDCSEEDDSVLDFDFTNPYPHIATSNKLQLVAPSLLQPPPTPIQETFKIFNGRRYHNEENVIYYIPNDEDELDRQSALHFLMKTIWGRNFLAPVDSVLRRDDTKVLDVGCGEGTWICDMASMYPASSFTGIDISGTAPTQIKPKKALFVRANIIDGLLWDDDFFNFIHIRFMLLGIPTREFKKQVLPELLRITKQQGMLEFMEMEMEFINPGPLLQRVTDHFAHFLTTKAIDHNIVTNFGSFLRDTGRLVNIQHQEKILLLGSRGDKLTELTADNIKHAWGAFRPVLTPVMGISWDDYDRIIDTIFTSEIFEHKTCIRMHRFIATKV